MKDAIILLYLEVELSFHTGTVRLLCHIKRCIPLTYIVHAVNAFLRLLVHCAGRPTWFRKAFAKWMKFSFWISPSLRHKFIFKNQIVYITN